jgi:hypothetical protein
MIKYIYFVFPYLYDCLPCYVLHVPAFVAITLYSK